MKQRVLVLGGSGMLGSMVADVLARNPGLEVTATVRTAAQAGALAAAAPGIAWRVFDADGPDPEAALAVLDGHGWIVNAIGITKPLIRDDNAAEIERAVRTNARLPYLIARRAAAAGARVLQIATDCVYSGAKGRYVETDAHDALDVYGKTKSLGEVPADHVHHLRASIVGPEPKDHKFLLDWFLGQARGAALKGFTNHRWNGVTTLHFARLCEGTILGGAGPGRVQHVVPDGEVTKCELLQCFARCYGREDLQIAPVEAAAIVDRTLRTNDAAANGRLWSAAGYPSPPSVPQMVAELAAFDARLARRGPG